MGLCSDGVMLRTKSKHLITLSCIVLHHGWYPKGRFYWISRSYSVWRRSPSASWLWARTPSGVFWTARSSAGWSLWRPPSYPATRSNLASLMYPYCGWRGMNLCKKNMCKNFVGSFAIYQIKKSAVGAGGVNSIPTGALELVQKILVTQYYSRSLIILRKSKGLHAVPLSSGSELFRKGKETIHSSGYFRANDDDTILDR